MDLNYLYHRHGISVWNAQTATCASSRHAHRGLAAAYARLIVDAKLARLSACA